MTKYNKTIQFIHTTGDTYTFKTCHNPLTNAQMWWFEPQTTMYAGTLRDVKTIVKNITANCEILSVDW